MRKTLVEKLFEVAMTMVAITLICGIFALWIKIGIDVYGALRKM